MKCIYLVVCLLMVSIGGAGAVPQNVTMGPYDVSFDMRFDEPVDYECDIVYGSICERNNYTEYMIKLGYAADICITELTGPDSWWGFDTFDELKDCYAPNDIVVHVCEIDGNLANLIMGYDMYQVEYILFNDTVKVFVHSNTPGDAGTIALLDSIHIEKVAM